MKKASIRRDAVLQLSRARMTQALISADIYEVGRGGADLSWAPSVVIFKGHRYRRNRHGYYVHSRVPPLRLHRELWVSANGPIPQWHHIHHEDGDQLNNLLSNLRCLSSWDHGALHGRERFRRGLLTSWLARRRNGRAS